MIKRLNVKVEKVAKRVLEIQLASYQVEADIINYADIPPLKDTLETVMNCNEEFWGYVVDNEIVAIVSYKIENRVLDIYRIAVDPSYFRRGIGRALVNFVSGLESVKKIEVCTGKSNRPAVELYLSCGFISVEDFVVDNKLTLTRFEKTLL